MLIKWGSLSKLCLSLLALSALGLAFSASALAATFTGDFETGNLSQWNYVQAIPGRVTVVKSPVAQGTYAGRFEVKEGDEDPDTHTPRAEVQSGGSYKAGEVRYFHIRSRISSWDYNHWGILWQLQESGGGSPPLALELYKSGSTPMLWLGSGNGLAEYWEAPLPGTEKWFELTVRVAFGTGTAGSVTVWFNGEPQTLTNGKLIYEGINTVGEEGPDFDTLGINRSKSAEGTAVVYDDDYRVMETLPSFTGDFETGDLSQWNYVQAIPGRVTVVKSPVAQGTYAGRFEVKEGDEEPDTKSQRAEVQSGGLYHKGEVRYFHFRSRVSSWDYKHWGLIWQLHDQTGGSPPVALELLKSGSTPMLWLGPGSATTEYWEAPLPGTEEWFEVIVRVEFGAEGSIKVWLNGKPQTLTNGKTIYEGINTLGEAPAYDKLGIYRSKSAEGTAVIYDDDYRISEVFP